MAGNKLAFFDVASKATRTITNTHGQIHEGDAFSATFSITTANTDDHRTAIGFLTPNTTKWFHLVVSVETTASAELFIIENPTLDLDAGTNVANVNRNRNATQTSVMLSRETAATANEHTTYSEAQIAAANFTPTTPLFYQLLGGGQGNTAAGGTSRDTQEWVLDQNQDYLVMIQNVGANANTHVIHLEWYEHVSNTDII